MSPINWVNFEPGSSVALRHFTSVVAVNQILGDTEKVAFLAGQYKNCKGEFSLPIMLVFALYGIEVEGIELNESSMFRKALSCVDPVEKKELILECFEFLRENIAKRWKYNVSIGALLMEYSSHFF